MLFKKPFNLTAITVSLYSKVVIDGGNPLKRHMDENSGEQLTALGKK